MKPSEADREARRRAGRRLAASYAWPEARTGLDWPFVGRALLVAFLVAGPPLLVVAIATLLGYV